MARREFTQVPYKYGDNKLGFALGQTRGGVEEFITPMAFWELDTASGLYMPPGESTNPKRPRVTVNGEVQVSGSKATPGIVIWDSGSGTSEWLSCAGYNRAVLLISGPGYGNQASPAPWTVTLQGRADTNVANLQSYFLNSGVAARTIAIDGYYELDINPLNELRVVVSSPSLGNVKVTVWLSATTFVPDTPGVSLRLFDALAITDTNHRYSPNLSGLGMKNLRALVRNTHDQALTMYVMTPTGTILTDAAKNAYTLSIPASMTQPALFTEADFEPFGGILPDGFYLRLNASVAPTSGSLTFDLLAEA